MCVVCQSTRTGTNLLVTDDCKAEIADMDTAFSKRAPMSTFANSGRMVIQSERRI
jgi:hypothetical protein